jgi:putative aldouronate transport system permease protein
METRADTFSAPSKSTGGRARPFARLLRDLRVNLPFLLMAAPTVVWVLIFSYLPMFGLIVAFKDYRFDRGILGSEWVGFENFRFLLGNPSLIRITTNTLLLNSLFIITSTVASLAIAILLYEIQHHILSKFYQSVLFFPTFISWVIVGAFVFALLNLSDGVVNRWITAFGFDKISWYRSPQYWPFILMLVNLWKGVGFGALVYFAGMLGINPEYYEAARLDGANGWQLTWRITLPLLLPIVTILTLLSIGKIFYADFGLFFHVTRDTAQLYPTTDVIDTFVFRALRKSGDISMASAAGFFQSLVGFVLVVLSNWIVRRIDPDRALF